MRLLIGSILVLSFMSGPAFGQLHEIRVDNSSMPRADIEQIYVDTEGYLVVESRAGIEYEIKEKTVVNDDDVAINSFTVNTKLSTIIEIGGSAQLRWNVVNADTCAASSIGDNFLDGWNSGTAVTTGIQTLDIQFPDAGSYNLTLTCTGLNGPVDAVVVVDVGGASITSFNVTPSNVERGTSPRLEISWSSENTSVGCFGSWPGSDDLPSSGLRYLTVSDIQATTEYTLTCAGAFDQDSATDSVIVTEPAETCDVTLESYSNKTWSSVLRTAWPGPSRGQVRVSVPKYGYYSLKFNTGTTQDVGVLSNIEASGTSGSRLGAISTVPGCFDVADECQYRWGRNGGIVWDTTGTAGGCQLKPNTDYYWNMTFTDGAEPASSTCSSGSACETYIVVYNPDD